MAHSTAGSYGTETPIPDGIEAVPRYHNYPEVAPSDVAKEAYSQQSTPLAAAAPVPVAPEKTICGLRRTTFILSVLLAIVVVGAAVGGGVGGSMAVSKAYDRGLAEGATSGTAPTTTIGGDEADATATATGDRVQPPPTKGLAELDCPNLSDSNHKVAIGDRSYTFRASCGVNHPNNKGAVDLAIIPAYSFEDCITACAAFNDVAGVKDTKCVLSHFNANLGLKASNGGNCWLKSKIGEIEVNEDPQKKDNQIEGELVST